MQKLLGRKRGWCNAPASFSVPLENIDNSYPVNDVNNRFY
jgi:hypothetical protein